MEHFFEKVFACLTIVCTIPYIVCNHLIGVTPRPVARHMKVRHAFFRTALAAAISLATFTEVGAADANKPTSSGTSTPRLFSRRAGASTWPSGTPSALITAIIITAARGPIPRSGALGEAMIELTDKK
jgi:hypothetical protein